MTNSLAADGQTTMTGAVKAQSGSAASPSYTFGADTNTGFYSAGADVIGVAVGGVAVGQITSSGIANTGGIPVTVPVGFVGDFAGASAPTGWLLCFGQSVATATYPALFAAIAYTYGGSGPNFTIPDCRGYATFGKDNMGGVAAGRITVAGGNFDGTVLGGTGGQQNTSIGQAHLPNVTLSTSIGSGQGSHTHLLVSGGSVVGNAGSGSIPTTGANFGVTTIVASTLPAMTGTTPLGGSSTAFPVLSNAIIFNKIIFAGA
jgi:microcystin-dependent protein